MNRTLFRASPLVFSAVLFLHSSFHAQLNAQGTTTPTVGTEPNHVGTEQSKKFYNLLTDLTQLQKITQQDIDHISSAIEQLNDFNFRTIVALERLTDFSIFIGTEQTSNEMIKRIILSAYSKFEGTFVNFQKADQQRAILNIKQKLAKIDGLPLTSFKTSLQNALVPILDSMERVVACESQFRASIRP